MIRSMTGFGRASFEVGGVTFDVEARSVNHRHLDVRARLPRGLAGFEHDVKQLVQARLDRGKVDVTVTAPDAGAPLQRLEIDREAARAYARAAAELQESEGIGGGSVSIDALLSLPGVARLADRDFSDDSLPEVLLAAVTAAVDALDAMRASEGEALERDLSSRLEAVKGLVEAIEARSGEVQRAVRERLRKRADQLELDAGVIDEARLHQEIVIAADRLDITEEIVRLRSHMDQFATIVAGAGPGEPVGRQLDFLMQEFGREANTIGSKGNDSPIAHRVVELKGEIERIREQVQNVE